MTGEERTTDYRASLAEGKPGAALRIVRLEAGLPLSKIAEQTLIPEWKLQDLEDDTYDRIGAKTFLNGYVRKYASLLKLDASEFVGALPEQMRSNVAPAQSFTETAANATAPKPRAKKSGTKRRLPVIPVVVFLIAAWAIAVYFIEDVGPGDNEAGTVEAASNIGELPNDEKGAPPIDSADTEDRGDFDGDTSVQEIPVLLDLPEADLAPVVATQEPALEAESQVTPDSTDATPSQDRLNFTFNDDCWLQVTDATGKVVFAQLQTKGDNLQLFGESPFSVMLGNARAVAIELNGAPVDINPVSNRKTLRFTVSS
ncbi:transcriptional regulator, Cro/CI family [Teredinibacter turnerae T7901]|uniref:Transcriptional regulator, Cro/CI family n=1 Tax=Teredinibacter turnerae (strain ATCC 39867 / T7901) TaxID=377629 RepID=C5BLW0_TERTT|nr:RodZ domain-containing protein [Teredinibacter turnerae]ACR10645.1 transcriptional regulator, Cro/CI family [Teredinibacter turnerae T7901]